MAELELSEIEAIFYAKVFLGRHTNFKQVYRIYSNFIPIYLPNPEPIRLAEPPLDYYAPTIRVDLREALVVAGDLEVKIYIGYCEELDTLVYYPKAYIRD